MSLNLQASETADDDIVIFEDVVDFDPGPPDPAWPAPYVEKYARLIESYRWTPESMLAEDSLTFSVTPSRVRAA